MTNHRVHKLTNPRMNPTYKSNPQTYKHKPTNSNNMCRDLHLCVDADMVGDCLWPELSVSSTMND